MKHCEINIDQKKITQHVTARVTGVKLRNMGQCEGADRGLALEEWSVVQRGAAAEGCLTFPRWNEATAEPKREKGGLRIATGEGVCPLRHGHGYIWR